MILNPKSSKSSIYSLFFSSGYTTIHFCISDFEYASLLQISSNVLLSYKLVPQKIVGATDNLNDTVSNNPLFLINKSVNSFSVKDILVPNGYVTEPCNLYKFTTFSFSNVPYTAASDIFTDDS